MKKFLSSVCRRNRIGMSIIHAAGVKSWRCYGKHDGESFYKIIWKERGTNKYIQDEYDEIIY